MGQIGALRLILEQIDSTNAYAMRLLSEQTEHGLIVMARNQTAGKGAAGATWHASPYRNLTCSVVLYPVNLKAADVFLLNAWCSLSVADVVAQYAGPVSVKWPNDVYVGDRKIAGVLIQTHIQGEQVVAAVAGVGLNVNESEFPPQLLEHATSIGLLTGKERSIEIVLDELVERMNVLYGILERAPARLAALYAARLYRLDLFANFHDALHGDFTGVIRGVARDGRLMLEKSGEMCYYAAKELTYI